MFLSYYFLFLRQCNWRKSFKDVSCTLTAHLSQMLFWPICSRVLWHNMKNNWGRWGDIVINLVNDISITNETNTWFCDFCQLAAINLVALHNLPLIFYNLFNGGCSKVTVLCPSFCWYLHFSLCYNELCRYHSLSLEQLFLLLYELLISLKR